MGKVPVLKPQEVIRILQTLGFEEVRQRGSHKQFRHVDGRATTVPFHKGRDIAPTLLRKIARDIGLTVEEFLAHRLARHNTGINADPGTSVFPDPSLRSIVSTTLNRTVPQPWAGYPQVVMRTKRNCHD